MDLAILELSPANKQQIQALIDAMVIVASRQDVPTRLVHVDPQHIANHLETELAGSFHYQLAMRGLLVVGYLRWAGGTNHVCNQINFDNLVVVDMLLDQSVAGLLLAAAEQRAIDLFQDLAPEFIVLNLPPGEPQSTWASTAGYTTLMKHPPPGREHDVIMWTKSIEVPPIQAVVAKVTPSV